MKIIRLCLSGILIFVIGCLIICHALHVKWLIDPFGIVVYFGLFVLLASSIIEHFVICNAGKKNLKND